YDAKTIDQDFAERDYFHGRGMDLPRNPNTERPKPIQHPHASIGFSNKAGNKLRVAFSVPVRDGGGDVLGVLALTLDPRYLLEMPQALEGGPVTSRREVCLVDRRGQIIQSIGSPDVFPIMSIIRPAAAPGPANSEEAGSE